MRVGGKQFRAKAITSPVLGLLTDDKTNPGAAFEVVGLDFADPVRYKKSAKTKPKVETF